MRKMINPPIITSHAAINTAEITICFFKAFLLSVFSLFVLQNWITEDTSQINAKTGSAKIINSIFFPY